MIIKIMSNINFNGLNILIPPPKPPPKGIKNGMKLLDVVLYLLLLFPKPKSPLFTLPLDLGFEDLNNPDPKPPDLEPLDLKPPDLKPPNPLGAAYTKFIFPLLVERSATEIILVHTNINAKNSTIKILL
jgi:hypothetical protein